MKLVSWKEETVWRGWQGNSRTGTICIFMVIKGFWKINTYAYFNIFTIRNWKTGSSVDCFSNKFTKLQDIVWLIKQGRMDHLKEEMPNAK